MTTIQRTFGNFQVDEDTTTLTWYQFFNHPDPAAMIGQVEEAFDGGFQNLGGRFGSIN